MRQQKELLEVNLIVLAQFVPFSYNTGQRQFKTVSLCYQLLCVFLTVCSWQVLVGS